LVRFFTDVEGGIEEGGVEVAFLCMCVRVCAGMRSSIFREKEIDVTKASHMPVLGFKEDAPVKKTGIIIFVTPAQVGVRHIQCVLHAPRQGDMTFFVFYDGAK